MNPNFDSFVIELRDGGIENTATDAPGNDVQIAPFPERVDAVFGDVETM